MTTLEHVLWIGGASASGKSTIATRLARRHGLRWYSADAHTWEHRDLALAAGHEGAIRWESMTREERHETLAESPAELVKLNLDFERGPMTVDDLRRLPAAPMVVADGSTILPELVAQGHDVATEPSGSCRRSSGTERFTRRRGWGISSSTAG